MSNLPDSQLPSLIVAGYRLEKWDHNFTKTCSTHGYQNSLIHSHINSRFVSFHKAIIRKIKQLYFNYSIAIKPNDILYIELNKYVK